MPKIKRTRKLVIPANKQNTCKDDIVKQGTLKEEDDEDVDSKLKRQIEISKQRIAMKYKRDTTPLRSLENSMLEDKLQRRRQTPRKELPDPTKGQSTPVKKATCDDPFGFDVLDSPLVFSPVLPSNPASSSHVVSEHNTSEVVKRTSFGTYDIPFKNGPPPGGKKKKQRSIQLVSDVEQWAQQLNAEFDEVDSFQLTVD